MDMKRILIGIGGLAVAVVCLAWMIKTQREEPALPPELDCPKGTYQVKDKCVERADLKKPAPAPLPTDAARQ